MSLLHHHQTRGRGEERITDVFHGHAQRLGEVVDGSELEAINDRLVSMGLSATVQTSFVERVNLTLRQRNASLARRTWSQNVMASELEIYLS